MYRKCSTHVGGKNGIQNLSDILKRRTSRKMSCRLAWPSDLGLPTYWDHGFASRSGHKYLFKFCVTFKGVGTL